MRRSCAWHLPTPPSSVPWSTTIEAMSGVPTGAGYGARQPASATAREHRWLDAWIVFTPLVSATFLAKIAPPVMGGARGLAVAFPLILLALLLGFATRRLQFVPHRLTFFLLMLSVLGIIQVMRGDGF